MVAGPEIPRATEEFEQSQELLEVSFEISADFHHHDQMKSVQKTFITRLQGTKILFSAFHLKELLKKKSLTKDSKIMQQMSSYYVPEIVCKISSVYTHVTYVFQI